MDDGNFYVLLVIAFISSNISNFIPVESQFLKPFMTTITFAGLYILLSALMSDFSMSMPPLYW